MVTSSPRLSLSRSLCITPAAAAAVILPVLPAVEAIRAIRQVIRWAAHLVADIVVAEAIRGGGESKSSEK